jgi:hypothetical protein
MRQSDRTFRVRETLAAPVLAVLVTACGAADRATPQTGSEPAAAVPPCGAVIPETSHGEVSCALRGTQVLGSGELIYAEKTGDAALARCTGGDVGIEVSILWFADEPRAKAAVRTPAVGPAVRMDGWLDLDRLSLHAQREIAVVPEAVWIRQGAPLALVAGNGGSVWVRSRYGNLAELTVEVDCGALGFEGVPDEPWQQPPGRAMMMLDGNVVVYGSPDAAPLCRLAGEQAPQPQLYALESRDGLERVAMDDADYRVTAWIPVGQLEDGVVPDCDDCRGSILDAEDVPELPPTARTVVATGDMAIHPTMGEDSPAIGTVEVGATVVIVEEQAGWGRIRPQTSGIVPPDAPPDGPPATEFWVRVDELGGVETSTLSSPP